jgi:hypothetical protein
MAVIDKLRTLLLLSTRFFVIVESEAVCFRPNNHAQRNEDRQLNETQRKRTQSVNSKIVASEAGAVATNA